MDEFDLHDREALFEALGAMEREVGFVVASLAVVEHLLETNNRLLRDAVRALEELGRAHGRR